MKKHNIINDPRLLYFATLAVLALPNIALSVTEPMSLMAKACNVILPVSVYALLLTVLRNPARGVWMMFLFIFLSAFQMVLLYLFGGSIIAVDMFLNLVTTNSTEVGELLGSLIPAVAGVAVVYLPILIQAGRKCMKKDYLLEPQFLRSTRRYAGVGACIGVLCLITCYASEPYRATDDLYPVNVCYNIGLAVDRSGRTAKYAETSAGFTFQARPMHSDESREVYVLVVGETARAENFSLYGYQRNTTPLLSTTANLIKFPQAYTQSNTTHKSVPMLLSASTAEDYNRIYREKGIISAFKEAGFHTVFISNQRPNHSFIDIFGQEADSWEFLKEELPASANVYDCDMLPLVDKILASGRPKQLIVLHCYGSHFKYRERYPAELAMFTPEDAEEALAENRDNLVNAYDNTILYTDRFLHSLIEKLAGSGAVAGMLYTSDHGENIFDDELGLFLHASPRPSAHELHVPLIAWLSDSYREDYPSTDVALRDNSRKRVITSASVFHTMLDIAGISTPVLIDSLSVASPGYKPCPYNYLSDRNIPVPVNEIIIGKPLDL